MKKKVLLCCLKGKLETFYNLFYDYWVPIKAESHGECEWVTHKDFMWIKRVQFDVSVIPIFWSKHLFTGNGPLEKACFDFQSGWKVGLLTLIVDACLYGIYTLLCNYTIHFFQMCVLVLSCSHKWQGPHLPSCNLVAIFIYAHTHV